jgi:hypothetical protein
VLKVITYGLKLPILLASPYFTSRTKLCTTGCCLVLNEKMSASEFLEIYSSPFPNSLSSLAYTNSILKHTCQRKAKSELGQED